MNQLLNKIFIISLFAISFVFVPGVVKADTWDMYGNSITVNMNKAEYEPNEYMYIDGSIQNYDNSFAQNYFGYYMDQSMHIRTDLEFNDGYGSIAYFVDGIWLQDTGWIYPSNQPYNFLERFAPSTPGSYSIGVPIYFDDSVMAYPSLSYQVATPAVCTNGATNYPTCTILCPNGAVTATNGDCASTTAPLSVMVKANGRNPETIPYHGDVQVTWTSVGATSCTCSYGDGIDCTPINRATAGPNIVARNETYTLDESKTFTVTCTDGVNSELVPGGSCPTYYASCFIKDTTVTMSDGTKKNIQDVKIGDILKGETTNNTVLGFHQPKLDGKKLYSFNGGRYFVTAEHPFKTLNGWKSIDPKLTLSENIGIKVTELKVGDTIITEEGNVLLKTISSKYEKADTQLYNFILDGDHTYYADDYLVHNKLACKDGQIPNPINGGCEPCGSLTCKTGYTPSCSNGATLCTKSSCAVIY